MRAAKYDEIVKEGREQKTPMNCSTCLWDQEGPLCLHGLHRGGFVKYCDGWEIDLALDELKALEQEQGPSIDTLLSNDAWEITKKWLREEFPNGHTRFIDLALDEIRLHSDKNHDYAKGGNPLGNFNRVGAILDLYPGLSPGDPVVVAVSFMLKQLDASLWMLSQGYAAKVEGHAERWRDIAIYAKIISILIEEKK